MASSSGYRGGWPWYGAGWGGAEPSLPVYRDDKPGGRGAWAVPAAGPSAAPPGGRALPPGYEAAYAGSGGGGYGPSPYDAYAPTEPSPYVEEVLGSVRNDFVRKVLTLVFLQVLLTAAVAILPIASPDVRRFVLTNLWPVLLVMVLSFVLLFSLFWAQDKHPWNLVLLFLFTLCIAYMVGVTAAAHAPQVMLQALFITAGTVGLLAVLAVALRRYDLSIFGYCMAGLLFLFVLAIVVRLIVGLFMPIGPIVTTVFAALGSLIFSGLLLFDLWSLMTRFPPDAYVLAAVSIYLDIINLFLYIVQLVSISQGGRQ